MLTQEKAREIIIKLKKDYGITYSYIAESIGISKSQLSLFIDDKRNFKRDKIHNLELFINSYKGLLQDDIY